MMMKKRQLLYLSSAVFACGICSSSATTLALYVNGFDYPDNAIPAASSAAEITASNIEVVGLGGGAAGNIRNSYGAVIPGGSNDGYWLVSSGGFGPSSDDTTSPPATDYHGYTLQVESGQTMSLNSLTFDWGFGNNNGAISNKTYGFRVFASVDGGSWVDVGNSSVTTSGNQGEFFGQGNANIDLSGLASSVDGGSVEVRIRPFTEANPGAMLSFQNLTFDGAVNPVPEPGSFALLGLGALACLLGRKRS